MHPTLREAGWGNTTRHEPRAAPVRPLRRWSALRWPLVLVWSIVAAAVWVFWGTLEAQAAQTTAVGSAQVVASDVRIQQHPDGDPSRLRVAVELSAPVAHKIFTLPNPPRLVVDLTNVRLKKHFVWPTYVTPVEGIRSGVRNGSDLRLVFDLAAAAKVDSLAFLKGDDDRHRLVVDAGPVGGVTASRPGASGASAVKVAAAAKPAASALQPAKTKSQTNGAAVIKHRRKVVVVIDPGHGGKDVGAVGRNGTYEKDVVLAISKYLKAQIDEQPGMRALLTRSDDRFIPLRKRMASARAKGADVFVSVHADAFKDARAHGSSVYILSQGGASSEAARWLAERENAADLVGGVTLSDKDPYLKMTLLDLSQTATSSASSKLARELLSQLNDVGHVKRNKVERAGFVVLKSPDIPSVLVETAFISNAQDEKRLRSPKHQRKLATAIAKGIVAHVKRYPPQRTIMAAREHLIVRGDTLSGIASRYGVPVSELRAANDMEGSLLRTGDKLRIPLESDG